MDIMTFLWSMKWEVLKNVLLNKWVDPHQLEWVDFNDMEQVNKFAEKLVPQLLKNNPFMANILKQNSSMLGAEKQKEVVDTINSI